jgi:hypothetical protein
MGKNFLSANNFKTPKTLKPIKYILILAVYRGQKRMLWFINYGAKLQNMRNNKIQNTSVFSESTPNYRD